MTGGTLTLGFVIIVVDADVVVVDVVVCGTSFEKKRNLFFVWKTCVWSPVGVRWTVITQRSAVRL